jgi:hypothetical protein
MEGLQLLGGNKHVQMPAGCPCEDAVSLSVDTSEVDLEWLLTPEKRAGAKCMPGLYHAHGELVTWRQVP